MARSYNSFARLGEGIYRFSRGTSGASGPRVTLLGGVHGNERIGVRVLDALRLALLTNAARVADGASVTLVYANTQALRVGTRGATPHADMNRCFTAEILSASNDKSSLYEETRARELAPLLAETDVLVDLHSTNKPSAPFVRLAGAAALTPESVRLAARLPCEILLHDPQYLIADGRVALTDEFVGANGGVGVCFESGLATDLSPHKVDSIVSGLWTILTHDTRAVEATPALAAANVPTGFAHAYEITQVFKLTSAGFRWADGVGDANFQRIAPRQPIGFVGDAAFAVDYEAFIVFPKVPALWKLGAPLGWLTKKKPTPPLHQG